MTKPLVVGFDLDMTLIDSRACIGAVYARLAEETGVFIDVDLVTSRLGPPLVDEMANWFPADRVDEMVARYRALYPTVGLPATIPMPGAYDALKAVRAAGGSSLVVTGKNTPNSWLHIEHLGFDVAILVGDVWAAEKSAALTEHGAAVYVGDHIGDIIGAHGAGALAVAVPTGGIGAQDLKDAGADVLLPDLTAFPEWFSGWLSAGAAT